MKGKMSRNIIANTPVKIGGTLIASCIFLLLACQGPASDKPAPADTMAVKPAAAPPQAPDTTTLGGIWLLQPILPSDTATGKRPFLRFDLAKSRFYGNSGCNNMNGQFWFSEKDSSLSFNDKILSTRMACPGYNEQAFIKSLLHTSHYRLKNGTLTFLSDDNVELSRWERKSVNALRPGKV
jgi:heat shock protein HslJ